MTKYCHITGATAYHYIYSNAQVRPLLRLNLKVAKTDNLLISLYKHTKHYPFNLLSSLKLLTLYQIIVKGKYLSWVIVLASTVKTAWQGLKCVLKGF